MPSDSSSPKYWAIIPAAGVGRRMGSDIPKQYLEIKDQTVLEYTIDSLLTCPVLSGVVLAMNPDDNHWAEMTVSIDKPLWVVNGGEERCHSVLNALSFLLEQADEHDWVLVHDAARPCLRHEDIELLIEKAGKDVGGILAVPVRDTMKRSDDDNHVSETVDRNQLWHALTPQMFRLGQLHTALQQALDNKALVTDEASAMELAGYKPLLVEGHADNIKITHPEDLTLAEHYLRQQGRI
jgi:2-C-methyl-D-erythritol 4-phosphate cytidylyltransferase